MLAIKLKRIGKKHQVAFRVVVAEKRKKFLGNFVEDLGFANPRTNEQSISAERARHWIACGAQPTATVHNLLVKAGILSAKKKAVHSVKKAENKKSA